MMNLFALAILIVSFLFYQAQAAYEPDGQNIALYWGAGGGQERLGYYCKSGAADIIMISFLNSYSADKATFNFGNACSGDTCPQIEEDIKMCQSLGIKVLLSFGGDDRRGKYGLKNELEGESLAQVVYDMFNPAGKESVTKPFGTAEIDGIDFDIENHNDKGLAALVTRLRTLWTSKKLLVSACPQCPYPDKNVLNLLQDKNAQVDLAFIQYYNNGCALKNAGTFEKNWKVWENFQETLAGNPNLKLYIGLSASTSSGYTRKADYIDSTSKESRKFKNFGGFFLWDAVSGFANIDKDTGLNYVYGIRNIIRNEKTVTTTIATTSISSTDYPTTAVTTVSSVYTTTSSSSTFETTAESTLTTKYFAISKSESASTTTMVYLVETSAPNQKRLVTTEYYNPLIESSNTKVTTIVSTINSPSLYSSLV